MFRQDVDGYEIDFGFGVGERPSVGSMVDADQIESVQHVVGGLDLDAPHVAAAVDDEVIALHVSVGQGQGEAEARGLA